MGLIKDALWHQGETDATQQSIAESYQARLTQMFQDLRVDLGAPDLPIVVGQLGPFLNMKKEPFADTFGMH